MTTTNHTGYRIEAFDHENKQLFLSPNPHARGRAHLQEAA